MFHDFVQSFESLVIVSIRMNGVRWQEWYRGFHVCYFLLLQYSLSILSPIWKSNSTSVKVWKSSKKTRFRQRSTVLKTSTYAMHSHQNCTMSLWPPHVPICHLRMRDIYDSVHTVATIEKLPEKALKWAWRARASTLICAKSGPAHPLTHAWQRLAPKYGGQRRKWCADWAQRESAAQTCSTSGSVPWPIRASVRHREISSTEFYVKNPTPPGAANATWLGSLLL